MKTNDKAFLVLLFFTFGIVLRRANHSKGHNRSESFDYVVSQGKYDFTIIMIKFISYFIFLQSVLFSCRFFCQRLFESVVNDKAFDVCSENVRHSPSGAVSDGKSE